MKILLVNDDGIEAEGIHLLERILCKIYQHNIEIVIYAPAKGIKGSSRALTLGEGKEVKVKKVGEQRYTVYGTPADCVEIACRVEKSVEIIFSGINHGWNLGVGDFYLSGTIQAAQHGVQYFGIPAVALSAPESMIFSRKLKKYTEKVLRKILVHKHTKGLININLPESGFRGSKVVQLGCYRAIGGLKEVREKWDTKLYNLLNPMNIMEHCGENPNTDVGAIQNGYVAITLHDGAEFF
ncbi:MAG: 5'/3'-nucleotidase SurE [Candidatus Moraniibacteriota bacterium]